MLRDNPKLKGVHSKASVQKILEKEAMKQLIALNGGKYDGPVVSTIIEKGSKK